MRSRAVHGVWCALMLAITLAAGAARAAAQATDSAGAPGHGPVYRGQVGFDELAARTTVPARLGDQPAATVAQRALEAVGWPIGASNPTRGMLVSQWLAFSMTSARSNAGCWIEVRLGVRPAKDDAASTELIAQLLLQGRFGTDAAVRLAGMAVEAFRADLLARAQSGHDAGRLKELLDNNKGTPSEYTSCGVRQHN